ncbi:hypothetical protein Luke3_00017 [Pseudomonas phage vB_PpuP-Luke-3]
MYQLNKHASTEHGFGSINKLQFGKGYYVVRYNKAPPFNEHHCNASNLRIAKKKLDACLRGELP